MWIYEENRGHIKPEYGEEMLADIVHCIKMINLHLPSIVSTQSCRPKFCCGFITQWLLVAVMSNTSHPPSDAFTVLELSKNVSASLKVRENNKTNICVKETAATINTHINS